MLLVPAMIIAMLLRRRHLVESLLAGIVAAVVLAPALGLIPIQRIVYIDRSAFGARGLIVDGLERGIGVSVFTLLLVALVAAVDPMQVLHRFARRGAAATSARRAEAAIVGSVSAAVLLTTHSVVAILTVGGFARETGERAGLTAYRRANLLDITVCTYPFLLPYFIPTILASSATASAGAMPRVSPLGAGLHNVYSWALLAMVVIAVATGYGRGEAPDDRAGREREG
jgi:Na+/H+ antiporter NhaC